MEAAPGYLEQPSRGKVTTWPRFAARYAKQPKQRLERTGERASCFMRVTVTAGRSTARRLAAYGPGRYVEARNSKGTRQMRYSGPLT